MENLKLIISILLFATNLGAQDWNEQFYAQSKLIDKISSNDDWENIHRYAIEELKIHKILLTDIRKTIEFRNRKMTTQVDSFFLNICESSYTNFPYRSSGRLSKILYSQIESDAINNFRMGPQFFRKNLYLQFAEIISIDSDILIPQLIQYLESDAATRLCLRPQPMRPFEKEIPYYLSISDVALELLELKTYCDFYRNSSFSDELFSNLLEEEKEVILNDVEKWYRETIELSTTEKVEYFLENICQFEGSYRFTCHNLLFAGDTIRAKRMYKKLYQRTKLPCRKAWDIGEILLALGDKVVLEDCMNTSINYRCMDDSGIKCVNILMNSEEAYYRDELFAEIISTEPYSTYRKSGTGPGYIWHKIFGELGGYYEHKLPKTLVSLMSIQSDFNSVKSYYTKKWRNKYPEKLLNSYRICDLALLEYEETIDRVEISNWNDIEERDRVIKSIVEKYDD